jgi:hypothetical protein
VSDPYIYDVFISYVGTDHAWVQHELLPRLVAAELCYTLSNPAAATTPARLQATETAIQQSRRLVAVLSTDYLANGLATFENLLAQTLDFQEMTFRVIPLIFAPFERKHLPTRLAFLAAADLTDPEKRERRFAELLELLKRRLPSIDD